MDVDIDDPDFWKKMVGEAQVDETEVETGKKRKRKQANYSEVAYKRQFDDQLKLSESDESDSDSDEIREDDFDEDDASDESGSQRKKRKKEYAKWGRKDSQGWKRNDADRLVKGLQAYGYGNMPWEDFSKKCELGDYDPSEVSLCYSIYVASCDPNFL
jgi:hypothetical protein